MNLAQAVHNGEISAPLTVKRTYDNLCMLQPAPASTETSFEPALDVSSLSFFHCCTAVKL